MSFTESLGRISQIQATLTQFDPAAAPTARAVVPSDVGAALAVTPGGGPGDAGGSGGATAFADTLASVLGPDAPAGVADATSATVETGPAPAT